MVARDGRVGFPLWVDGATGAADTVGSTTMASDEDAAT
jgi:hypothetical protein